MRANPEGADAAARRRRDGHLSPGRHDRWSPNPTLTTSPGDQRRAGGLQCRAVTMSTSSCPLPVRLPMQLQIPPYLVSFGNTAGDVYTFTVRNTGTTTATDVSFEIDPSQGFFFKAASAGLQHSQCGPLAVSQPLADTTPGEPFVLAAADPSLPTASRPTLRSRACCAWAPTARPSPASRFGHAAQRHSRCRSSATRHVRTFHRPRQPGHRQDARRTACPVWRCRYLDGAGQEHGPGQRLRRRV